MKRPAKKRVVSPRAPIAQASAPPLPVESGSLFDMNETGSDETGSLETFTADKVGEAIGEPLRDVSGEHRVAEALGSDQRSDDQDEKKRFSDPSRIIEAANLPEDAFKRDEGTADSLFGTLSGDDDDEQGGDSSNGVS